MLKISIMTLKIENLDLLQYKNGNVMFNVYRDKLINIIGKHAPYGNLSRKEQPKVSQIQSGRKINFTGNTKKYKANSGTYLNIIGSPAYTLITKLILRKLHKFKKSFVENK